MPTHAIGFSFGCMYTTGCFFLICTQSFGHA